MSAVSFQDQTDANQALASNPEVSAWVSANAGTGKTTVLVRRVLRLLLQRDPATGDFNRPENILCLTYTKAAAGEMKNRLFKDLTSWATADDGELDTLLSRVLDGAPGDAQRERARQLFAVTLDTRGGLKIYTIHAFCERLLHRFPLEAGVASGFRVLDEVEHRLLLDASVDAVLARAARPDDAISDQLNAVVANVGEETFRQIVDTVLDKRDMLRAIIRHGADGDFAGAERDAIARLLGAPADTDENAFIEEMAAVLDAQTMRAAVAALEASDRKTDRDTAAAMRNALDAGDAPGRAGALEAQFLTQNGCLRKTIATKAVTEAHPGLMDTVVEAQARFHDLACKRAALHIAGATGALLALADAIFDAYERRKRARAALDYDDLIDKTGDLLGRTAAAAWVLYKLDYGIDHVLVDEAQDTSPAQWRVIDALTDEFFAGESARESARTVFAVGDEKQSIYSFQGADPVEFATQGRRFRRKADEAGEALESVPLTVSFRSTQAILDAVDAVFGQGEAKPALTFGGDYQPHHAVRAGDAGLVEIWPVVTPDDAEPPPPFRPDEEGGPARAPADMLAARIAGTILGWLDSGVELESRARPIRPGDILILVPRRGVFTRAMIRELKARGIAVAGADRMMLAEQLAVMDLMALADFLLMSEDDLALATALKSPLFGFDDDDLFALAWERKGSLWEALRDSSGDDEKFADAAERLNAYLKRTDFEPPYEFFAELLEENGMAMRHALIARLGAEAGDALDEFLNLALAWGREHPPSLQGFLDYVRDAGAEVKRDMEQGRDEVRVMTVYGAKGLEADIVFLPDTCAIPRGAGGATVLDMDRAGAPPGAPDHIVWVPSGTAKLNGVEDAREEKKLAARAEYYRLLYVAMTRARDRLYICGWETSKKRETGCWYDLVTSGLQGLVREVSDSDGVLRFETQQTPGEPRAEHESKQPPRAVDLPPWASRNAPDEAPAVLQTAPSAIVTGDDGEGVIPEQPVLPPDELSGDSRFLRGRIVHALLQHLPDLADDQREAVAEAHVGARGRTLDAGERAAIVRETLAVLRDPDFAPLFGPGSLAEVPLVARLDRDPETGPPLEITGQIDRLVVLDNAVLIVDYKTNRPPPGREEDVAPGYIAQLAAYRAGIREIFPEKTVRAALLWTVSAHLMPISERALDESEALFTGGAPSP